MKKKAVVVLMLAALVLGITGCGKDESGKYAIIDNRESEEAAVYLQDVLKGLQEYTVMMEAGVQMYTAEGTERKDYAQAIELAVDNGAEVIICAGEDLEVPVCEAQRDYQRVKFILLDGEPHKRYAKKTNMEDNTVSLYFNETQQGFVTGYMAVLHGCRNIGCMGGVESESNLKIAAGFVQGVEAAAKELGLEQGSVVLNYTFTGVDKLSPAYMSKASKWYEEGCEVIFTLDEGVQKSVIEAAKLHEGRLMTADPESLGESELILTAGYLDYAGAVIHQLELIEQELFVGNQVVNCGVKEGGVSVITEGIGFSDNTMSQYNMMCNKLAEGTLQVEETMAVPVTNITTVVKE